MYAQQENIYSTVLINYTNVSRAIVLVDALIAHQVLQSMHRVGAKWASP